MLFMMGLTRLKDLKIDFFFIGGAIWGSLRERERERERDSQICNKLYIIYIKQLLNVD